MKRAYLKATNIVAQDLYFTRKRIIILRKISYFESEHHKQFFARNCLCVTLYGFESTLALLVHI